MLKESLIKQIDESASLREAIRAEMLWLVDLVYEKNPYRKDPSYLKEIESAIDSTIWYFKIEIDELEKREKRKTYVKKLNQKT